MLIFSWLLWYNRLGGLEGVLSRVLLLNYDSKICPMNPVCFVVYDTIDAMDCVKL